MTEEYTVPAQIIEFIYNQALPIGSHLSAQRLADHLSLSRSPVTKALSLLEEKGIVYRQPRKGCFLNIKIEEPLPEFLSRLELIKCDPVNHVYFQIAEDRLQGLLDSEFSEKQLKKRYGLTSAQLQAVLGRITEEGWVYKKPGYGWAFSPMLTTPESLIQTYRLRLALEPAALLEPGYHIDQQTLERCREAEVKILKGGTHSYTADQLHQRGVKFHVTLVEASGNPFFIDTINRIHRIRRLLSYRSMKNRERYKEHAQQHLEILDLLEQKKNHEASEALKNHLEKTIKNISEIKSLLDSEAT